MLNPSMRYEFNSLSSLQRGEIEKIYEDFAEKIQNDWIQILDELLSAINKKIKSCEEAIKKIKSDPLYIKGEEYISANKHYAAYQEQISQENVKLQDAKSVVEKRNSIQEQIDELKKRITVKHCSFKEMVSEATQKIQINAGNIFVRARPQLKVNNMRDYLEPKLIKRSEAQRNLIVDLTDKYFDNTEEKMRNFINGLLDQSIQCTNGNFNYNVMQNFLAENWYGITYDLIYQNDNFTSMSPGKQSFVILNLLLEFSSRKCPILIDQPEDSLDNRAIYSELVSYLKTKKKTRQIILVSHNPNVVVGADAEEVIVANQNGSQTTNIDGLKFQYLSGALEYSSHKNKSEKCILASQGIREHVCDILEGGKEAFNRREKKYGFNS